MQRSAQLDIPVRALSTSESSTGESSSSVSSCEAASAATPGKAAIGVRTGDHFLADVDTVDTEGTAFRGLLLEDLRESIETIVARECVRATDSGEIVSKVAGIIFSVHMGTHMEETDPIEYFRLAYALFGDLSHFLDCLPEGIALAPSPRYDHLPDRDQSTVAKCRRYWEMLVSLGGEQRMNDGGAYFRAGRCDQLLVDIMQDEVPVVDVEHLRLQMIPHSRDRYLRQHVIDRALMHFKSLQLQLESEKDGPPLTMRIEDVLVLILSTLVDLCRELRIQVDREPLHSIMILGKFFRFFPILVESVVRDKRQAAQLIEYLTA